MTQQAVSERTIKKKLLWTSGKRANRTASTLSSKQKERPNRTLKQWHKMITNRWKSIIQLLTRCSNQPGRAVYTFFTHGIPLAAPNQLQSMFGLKNLVNSAPWSFVPTSDGPFKRKGQEWCWSIHAPRIHIYIDGMNICVCVCTCVCRSPWQREVVWRTPN